MANIAYLRVSTDRQDVNNQRHGILEYANSSGISGLTFIEDTASGQVNWRQRKLGTILNSLNKRDIIIFSEISRIARSTLQVLEVLEYCISHEIHVHIEKQRMIFDGSMQSKITATVLGIAAEIEREFISLRTREALAIRKKNGMTLGRPKGPAISTKLDKHRPQIQDLINKRVSKRSIAKIIECAPSTLYDYIKRKKMVREVN
ncbi:recombinase family protein [Marinomonas sp. 2405UD68-3]|uniref:recombinase family protein n=1 Tax=Marinomonas sp. 2405UD68-3 TaxID=3391835 RepID=UPI0039C9CBD4